MAENNGNSNGNGNGTKAVIHAIGAAAFVEAGLSELLNYCVRKAKAYNQRRKALKSAPNK
jgi:hypothetical protein